MGLAAALGVTAGEMVALVGAGGKTTAAWRLLRELSASGQQVVFTTTTRIFCPREARLLLAARPDPTEVARWLAEEPALVLAAAHGERGDADHAARCPYPADPVKLVGLEPEVVGDLARALPGVTWLVEADGAKGRLLKAPAEHEPVVPVTADRAIIVAGLGALGAPLDERTVHRPERAAWLLGVPTGTPITPALVARLIAHPAGGLKGLPPRAAVVVLLARWDGPPRDEEAAEVARRLLSETRIASVVQADLRAGEAVVVMRR
jgi:probable selenium-dependent hydroxylase accessory protein YqeC